jgi:hypothetical protein
MKKNLFKILFSTVIILLLNVVITSAQITITGADLPQTNSNYITVTDSTPGVSLGTPGSVQQQWDFSTLDSSYSKIAIYKSTSNTPYANIFSASNIYTYGPAALFTSFHGGAPLDSTENGYIFWESDDNGLKMIGFREDSGQFANKNVFVNPPELLIGTPATYGSVFNNHSSWELSCNNNPADQDTNYVCDITKTLTSDAWGTLITPSYIIPYNSYPDTFDVLRIHEYLIKIDSIYVMYNGAIISSIELLRDTLNNYIYMANEIGYPVAIAHADVNNIIKDIEYLKGYYDTIINDTIINQIILDTIIPVDTISVNIDSCIIDYMISVDSAYINNFTVVDSTTIIVTWSFWQNGTETTITVECFYIFPGANVIYLTIYCDNGSKSLNSTTFGDGINIRYEDINDITENEINNNSSLLIYPVPVIDNLNIKANLKSGTKLTLTITNIMGQQMGTYDFTLSKGEHLIKMPVNNLLKGIYLINITSYNGKIKTVRKFVK